MKKLGSLILSINNTTNSTNGTTTTTPNQLNQTRFNGVLFVAGLAVMTLGAGLVVVNRKINA